MNPLVIELAFMTVLTGLWLGFHGRVLHLDNGTFPYHVALERRDSRKAKFYFASVWIGLLAAFLSARTLEAMWSVNFDSATQKSWILGGLRGVEMWGLFIVGAVWSRIGIRASQSNMDGKSLLPAPQKREDTRDTSDNKNR